jgi:hypothetical protein
MVLALLPLSAARGDWDPDGTVVCDASASQTATFTIADGVGGAFIVWTDQRNGNRDIFIQRMNALGNAMWAPNGVVVCNAASEQDWPSLLADGSGGVIVAWSDFRDGATSHYDIYAQRFNGAGARHWAPNGVAVCTAVRGQYYPTMTSNGAGGAIFAWTDHRLFIESDVYAMRLDAGGGTPPAGIPDAPGDTPGALGITVLPAWPNPFAGSTGIDLRSNAPTSVSIDVTDAGGRRVRRLALADPLTGSQRVTFDGRNDVGRPLAPGVYFMRVEADGLTNTQKLVKVQ